jgi:hypothetical protein
MAGLSAQAAPGVAGGRLMRKSLGEGATVGRRASKWMLGREHLLVDLGHVPGPADLARLKEAGARVVSLVPMTGLIVNAPDGTRAADLGVPMARRLGAEEKISAALRSGGVRDNETAEGWYVVEFHPDVNVAVERAIAIESGFLVRDNPDVTVGQLLVEGTDGDLEKLAAWDEVNYIFPASRALVNGEPVYVCAGADTGSGTLGQSIPLIGDGWDGPGLGSATLGYAFENMTSQLSPDEVTNAIVSAFGQWSNVVQVNFQASANPLADETIAILFASGAHGDPYPFGPAGTILAHTFYPAPPNPEPIAGDMHFNDANVWGIGNHVDLFSLALHETGHALGLGHSDLPSAVMYPYFKVVNGLTPEDIAAVQMLYASRAAGTSGSGTGTQTGSSGTGTSGTPASGSPTGGTPTTGTPTSGTPTGGTPTGGNPTSGTPTGGTPTGGTPTSGTKDTTPPVLTIVSPAASTYSTSNSTIVLKGLASDNTGVGSVTWSTSTGLSGVAAGTAQWQTAPIPLFPGMNVISVAAKDVAGNSAWRTVMVNLY